jgi:hypothetical protein
MKPTPCTLLLASLLLAPTTARAGDLADFGEDVKDATSEYTSQYVIDHLTSMKLGSACWKKMHDKDQNGIHTATFWTRYVAEYAKRVTKDDWSSIETQNNSDRDKNKPLVEKLVKDFKGKLAFTLVAEGADCDTSMSSLMLRYWSSVGESLQYLSGKTKVSITLTVTPKTKDITVTVAGGTISIVGSRDIEPAEWSEKIAKAFRRAKL